MIDELIGRNARERLTAVKRGLQSILELLRPTSDVGEFRLAPPVSRSTSRVRAMPAARVKPSRGKPVVVRRRSR